MKNMFIAMAAFLLLTGCNHPGEPESLRVVGGESVIYLTDNGEQIRVSYYALSDSTLFFARLTMPGGMEYTLPQVVSASGARYTDDRDILWWIKGETATLQTRDSLGAWQTISTSTVAGKPR